MFRGSDLFRHSSSRPKQLQGGLVTSSPRFAVPDTPINVEINNAELHNKKGGTHQLSAWERKKKELAQPETMQQNVIDLAKIENVLKANAFSSPKEKQMWELKKRQLEWAVEIGEDEATIEQDFRMWLVGKGKENDHMNTPWYRTPQNMRIKGCNDFLTLGLDVQFEFMAQLMLLEMRGPADLDSAWLYFKYIVRGGFDNPDTMAFIKDWEMLNSTDSAKLGIEPELMEKIAGFWRHQQPVNKTATTEAFAKGMRARTTILDLFNIERNANAQQNWEELAAARKARKDAVAQYTQTFGNPDESREFVKLITQLELESTQKIDRTWSEYQGTLYDLGVTQQQLTKLEQKEKYLGSSDSFGDIQLTQQQKTSITRKLAINKQKLVLKELELEKLKTQQQQALKTATGMDLTEQGVGANDVLAQMQERINFDAVMDKWISSFDDTEVPTVLFPTEVYQKYENLKTEIADSKENASTPQHWEKIVEKELEVAQMEYDIEKRFSPEQAELKFDKKKAQLTTHLDQLLQEKDIRMLQWKVKQSQATLKAEKQRLQFMKQSDFMNKDEQVQQLEGKIFAKEDKARMRELLLNYADDQPLYKNLRNIQKGIEMQTPSNETRVSIVQQRIGEVRMSLAEHQANVTDNPIQWRLREKELNGQLTVLKELKQQYKNKDIRSQLAEKTKVVAIKANAVSAAKMQLTNAKEKVEGAIATQQPVSQIHQLLQQQYEKEDELFALTNDLEKMKDHNYKPSVDPNAVQKQREQRRAELTSQHNKAQLSDQIGKLQQDLQLLDMEEQDNTTPETQELTAVNKKYFASVINYYKDLLKETDLTDEKFAEATNSSKLMQFYNNTRQRDLFNVQRASQLGATVLAESNTEVQAAKQTLHQRSKDLLETKAKMDAIITSIDSHDSIVDVAAQLKEYSDLAGGEFTQKHSLLKDAFGLVEAATTKKSAVEDEIARLMQPINSSEAVTRQKQYKATNIVPNPTYADSSFNENVVKNKKELEDMFEELVRKPAATLKPTDLQKKVLKKLTSAADTAVKHAATASQVTAATLTPDTKQTITDQIRAAAVVRTALSNATAVLNTQPTITDKQKQKVLDKYTTMVATVQLLQNSLQAIEDWEQQQKKLKYDANYFDEQLPLLEEDETRALYERASALHKDINRDGHLTAAQVLEQAETQIAMETASKLSAARADGEAPMTTEVVANINDSQFTKLEKLIDQQLQEQAHQAHSLGVDLNNNSNYKKASKQGKLVIGPELLLELQQQALTVSAMDETTLDLKGLNMDTPIIDQHDAGKVFQGYSPIAYDAPVEFIGEAINNNQAVADMVRTKVRQSERASLKMETISTGFLDRLKQRTKQVSAQRSSIRQTLATTKRQQ
jgi:hypothetical protein